jgi:hypothetical protein
MDIGWATPYTDLTTPVYSSDLKMEIESKSFKDVFTIPGEFRKKYSFSVNKYIDDVIRLKTVIGGNKTIIYRIIKK